MTRMPRQGSVGVLHASMYRVAVITAVVLIMLRAVPAHADAVGQLIGQLEDSSDKIRLAAALNLSKLGDAKAILPLAKAVGNDSSEKVRGAAAVGLGKLVTASTSKSIRGLAVKALQRAAADDASTFVKDQANKALTVLGAGGGGSTTNNNTTTNNTTSSGGAGIYVNIGPMSSKTGDATQDPKLRALMVKSATRTMAKSASKMATTFPGGIVPTAKQLSSKGFSGFYVDGTLNELKVTTSGSTATVSCKVSMLLASFPDKSVFGFLNGGAKVQGSTSDRDIAMSGEDCVDAVIESLIATKIVPTICTKATCP